jgi:Zn-dependent alcohol dehydrogenase
VAGQRQNMNAMATINKAFELVREGKSIRSVAVY